MPAARETLVTLQDVPTFTGKRREKLKRVCACGCKQKFTTTDPRKIYKNDAHRKRKDRARMRTNQ